MIDSASLVSNMIHNSLWKCRSTTCNSHFQNSEHLEEQSDWVDPEVNSLLQALLPAVLAEPSKIVSK